jgi:hypothetical protein
MFKFSYVNNGQVEEVEFNKYYELVRFVAQNKVRDDDFVSMSLGDEVTINGLDNLAEYAIQKSNEAEEAERQYEEYMREMQELEEFESNDEDYDEDEVVY